MDYVDVEYFESSKLGIKSEATIILKYAVEYSFDIHLNLNK